MKFPAISLDQQYPTLVACQFKTNETRSWPAPRKHWGSRILIHATKKRMDTTRLVWLADTDPRILAIDWETVPYGAAVATARLRYCGEVIDHIPIIDTHGNEANHAVLAVPRSTAVTRHEDGRTELIAMPSTDPSEDYGTCMIDPFGDYSIGRWIWKFSSIESLPKPIPMRGRQRMWTAEL